MEKAILVVHLITAIAIIGMILLQQGKGAESGASFGAGASQTVFGSAGSWNFFSKLTAILATIFFVTSFGLAIAAKNNATIGEEILPELESVRAPVEETDIPLVDDGAVEIEEIPLDQLEADLSDEIPAVDEN